MEQVINVIVSAGRSALDVALYTLLPIMVVMTIILRLLEVYGVLDRLVIWLTPLGRPFGLQGLAALAILQSSLISFIAPLPTLKLMETRGASNRHLAAALAAVFASAPANATYPLAIFGLGVGSTIVLSVLGAVAAGASTYWLFGRYLGSEDLVVEQVSSAHSASKPSLMDVINGSGGQAVQSIIGIIPTLLVSLTVVFALQAIGVVTWLVAVLASPLAKIGVDTAYVLPFITKYLAGNTAMVALFHEMAKQPNFDPMLVVRGSGILINPLDLPGIGIFTTAGPRLAKVLLPALAGGIIGILLRTVTTAWLW